MTDITHVRGDSVALTHTITRGTPAVAVDLTGATLTLTVKTDLYADSNVFQKTIGSGITVATPASGVATTAILPANTATLPAGTLHYVWDLEMVEANTAKTTVDSGAYTITQGVT
jgi:hypothetical protein